MKRVNDIINNSTYKEYLEKIKFYEKDRIFCNHNLEHFLNMSRIAYILILENRLGMDKEVVYAVGLLHDIGRWQQYENGVEHHKASVELSIPILKECNYTDEEINLIANVILGHRNKNNNSLLEEIFYKADKISRNCLECEAKEQCNWSEEKKNLYINY